MVKKSKQGYYWIGLLSVILLVLLIKIFVFESNIKFNTEIWLDKPEVRKFMLKDLIDSKRLIGLHKDSVYILLGRECKYCEPINDAWMYYIEIKDGQPDPIITILDVEFINDRVTSVSVRKGS